MSAAAVGGSGGCTAVSGRVWCRGSVSLLLLLLVVLVVVVVCVVCDVLCVGGVVVFTR